MSNINSARAKWAPELKETMTGSSILIGTLLHSPVQIIFDNLGDVEVELSLDGDVVKTFAAGEAIVLDMRANHGFAEDFTFQKGSSFYGNGASGDFSISYTYAKEL